MNQRRDRRQDLGQLWVIYKNRVLRAVLAVAASLLLLAGIVPAIGRFLEHQKFIGFGFGLALLLLVLDAILSPADRGSTVDSKWPPVLQHTADLSQLLPALHQDPHLELALASYSSETFYSVLSGFLDEVATGRSRVRHISLRLLVPDCSAPMGVPCILETGRESPAYKKYLVQRTDRFVREFESVFERIRRDQPQINALFAVRYHRMSPLFKAVIINSDVAYFGVYPIDRTPVELRGGEKIFLDYRGERASLLSFQHDKADERQSVGFDSIVGWYESVWASVPTSTVQV